MRHVDVTSVKGLDGGIEHLEICQRCRETITADVDLDGVLERILAETVVELSRDSRPSRVIGARPWIVVGSVAVLVLALFLPQVLLDRSDSVGQGNTEGQGSRWLAAGGDWSITVWDDAGEICYQTRVGAPSPVDDSSFGSEVCLAPQQFSIPGIGQIDVIIETDSRNRPIRGTVMGLVAQHADRLVVDFESGAPIEVIPGDRTELGLRGFGLVRFDAVRLGEPTTVAIYSGDNLLGLYSHTEGRDISG